MRRWATLSAAVALLALGCGVAAGADASVSCSYDPAVSTGCSAPQVPVTVTETTTAAVTPAPVTSTVTETPAPVTVPGPTTTLLSTIVGPTTTVVGPTTTVTVTTAVPATTAATTTAATTTAAAACAGIAGQEGGTDPFGTCWPGPANTGVPAGTVLTVVTGNQTYSTPNQVISGKDIRGCVSVTAAGVTIKNSKITCSNFYAVDFFASGARLTLQDDTISCGNAPGTGVGEIRVTAIRVNISGCENGFDADSDVTVTDSYIHDLYQSGTAHTDGIQSAVGSNLLLDHNVWYSNNGTSAMIINNNPAGPHSANTTISRNLVAGGAYTIYCPRVSDTNYQVINNRFSRKFYSTVGAYGPVSDCTDEVWTGNVYADTGQPVPVG